MLRLRIQLAAFVVTLFAGCANGMAALPPPDAPAPHWPWWLRILAVIGALAFIQVVARSMRKGTGRAGPNPDQKE